MPEELGPDGRRPAPSRRWPEVVRLVLTAALVLGGATAIVLAVVGPRGTDVPVAATTAPQASAPEQPAVQQPAATTEPAQTTDPGQTTDPAPPASTSPADIPVAQLADPAWIERTAAVTGVPARALAAYAGSALAVAHSDPGCGIGWNTLAAIGLVESAHGSMNGATLGDDGVVAPSIVGVALDGGGVAAIRDTDDGRLDGDATWDRAVGPMQFIPSTWRTAAQDGNKDGTADVNQIDDASLAAAVYLCTIGGDLTDPDSWIRAVAGYNRSVAYNNRVAEAATRYAQEAG